MLVQMIYASRPTHLFTHSMLGAILTAARVNNPRVGLTGMLVYSNKYFLQVLEGNRNAVNALLHNLVRDERHSHFMLMRFATISERYFPHWSMGYAPEVMLSRSTLFKHGVTNEFNPYVMTEAHAEQLFFELGQVSSGESALPD